MSWLHMCLREIGPVLMVAKAYMLLANDVSINH